MTVHAATTQPMTAHVTRRPGRAGYWLGALIALLSAAGALAWGTIALLGWQSHIQEFPRLTHAGTVVVTVTDPGTRFVYLEHDRSAVSPTVHAVSVTGPSGAQVPVRVFGAVLRYDAPRDSSLVGDAVLLFPADEPGTYRVTVGEFDPGTSVAVGDPLVNGWVPHLVGSVGLLLGGLLAGLVVVSVTAARRTPPSG